MLNNWVNRLGQDPSKSWIEFKLGLAVFASGAGLILLGPMLWVMLQIPGMLLLAVGLLIAGKGYVGILASRFASTLNQLGAAGEKEKRSNRPK